MVEAQPLVSVTIVTFNSARHIARCLQSLREQQYSPIETVVVDNASSDETRKILEAEAGSARIILNDTNRGFAAAQNQAIAASAGGWVLCLNPDVLLRLNFIQELMKFSSVDARVGTLCGKLLRWQIGKEPELSNAIDSTGIYFLPNLRHLDRGAEEEDRGQFNEPEYVFGATGAAALYRREMIQDVSVKGEFFDEEFFSYREDADLAWRAQVLGWKCLYVPAAVGWHERRVTPERRQQLPHEINWHSVKNRFLMRAKNIGRLWLRNIIQHTVRDSLIFGYAVLRDRKLLSAMVYPIVHFRRVLPKRRLIQAKRRVSDRELARWFRWEPTSEPFKQT